MEMLHKYYKRLADLLFKAATSEGNLQMLKWGHNSGYVVPSVFYNVAALNGHLEVVKYLRKLSIRWHVLTCNFAAKNGHLGLLKWARVNQFHGMYGHAGKLLGMVTLSC